MHRYKLIYILSVEIVALVIYFYNLINNFLINDNWLKLFEGYSELLILTTYVNVVNEVADILNISKY